MSEEPTKGTTVQAAAGRSQLVLLQTLITIVLSYQLLFSKDARLVFEEQQWVILGLMVVAAGLMLLPSRLWSVTWVVGLIVLLDTAVTSFVFYLAGNADSDLYLIYFLILLIAAFATTLQQMIAFSVILCAAYGVNMYVVAKQTDVFLEGYFIRIPVLLVLATFYGVMVETVRKERHQKTDLLTAIAALKKSEAKREQLTHDLRLLLESTGEGIYGIDKQGRCTFINTAAARKLGYEPEAVLGKPMHTLIHHSRHDGSPYPVDECQMCRVFRTGKGRHMANEVLWRRDVTAFPADYVLCPVIEQGETTGAVVAFTDSTERARAEEKLRRFRESEERYRYFVNHTTDVVYTADAAGHVTFCNPAAITLLQYSTSELVGRHYLDFVQPHYRQDTAAFYEQQFQKKIPVTYYELPVVAKDGTERWFGQHVVLVIEKDRMTGFQVLARDLT